MKYHYPEYYHRFRCIGGACQDTCCRGWRIGIDQRSYRKYRRISGAFGMRLRRSMDHKNRVFHLKGRDCPFLNREGLCDIYRELGEDMLCHTCRTYPRHREDYGELQEMMLSLSCPEAAGLILQDQNRGMFLKKETSRQGEVWNDRELLESLLQARQTIIGFLTDRSMDFFLRLAMTLGFAHDVQRRLNHRQEGLAEELKRLTDRYQASGAPVRFQTRILPYTEEREERMLLMNLFLRELTLLEPVMENWSENLELLCRRLYHQQTNDQYQQNCAGFSAQAGSFETEWENVVIYFINTYLVGAIYDNDVISKVKMAVVSYLILREQCLETYIQDHKMTAEQLLTAACHYSREVENSWSNQLKIEQMMKRALFSVENLLKMLV